MPHVFMTCYEENFSKDVLRSIQEVVRHRAAQLLSVEDRQLTRADFSFHFLPAGELDDLAKDLMIIIMAHADEERVPPNAIPDQTAKSIGEEIEMVLSAAWTEYANNSTYSVSLMLGEMGYFAGEAQSRLMPATDR